MRQASKRIPESAEKTVRDIRRATRRHHSAEEKIRIVLEGLRGEDSIAETVCFQRWIRCTPPSPRPGGAAYPRSLCFAFNMGPESETGSRSPQRTDIKVLYCFHQNTDDPECEAVHTSLPIRP